MKSAILISEMRELLKHPPKDGKGFTIRLWTKSGEIQTWTACVPLRYEFYKGTRRFKLLHSGQIRQARDVLIFEINGQTVFL